MRWLQPPVEGFPISQRFGVNRKYYPPFKLRNGQTWPGGHEGLDYATPKGTPVRAAHDGVVVEAKRLNAAQRAVRALQPPYGESARLETTHEGKRITTIYGHLDRLAAWVKPGAAVRAGDVLGWSGNTGRVLKEPGYHLHFGVNVNDYPVDPETVLMHDIVHSEGA